MAFAVLFDYFETQIFTELENEAEYISYSVMNEGVSYIDNFNGDDKRITLVDADGNVLADTSANAEGLENHGERSEIKDANAKGVGKSSRYSDTLMTKTLYYAKKFDDGTILRVSTTRNSVIVILLGLLYPTIIIIVLALILSAILSNRVSKKIIKPINEIDLENPSENIVYEEITPLLKKISTQNKTIDRQLKEAKQRQEEFKLITENMSEGLLVID